MATDILGREYQLDQWVAYADSTVLKIGKICKITPQMVRIVPAKPRWKGDDATIIRRQEDVMILKEADVTFYLLSA